MQPTIISRSRSQRRSGRSSARSRAGEADRQILLDEEQRLERARLRRRSSRSTR